VLDGLVVAAEVGESVGNEPGEGFGVRDWDVADLLPAGFNHES
jgi:hypothetical protein